MSKSTKMIVVIALISIGVGIVLSGTTMLYHFFSRTYSNQENTNESKYESKYDKTDIRNINIEVGGGEIYILESEDEEIEINASDIVQCEIRNNTLLITNKRNKDLLNESATIYLYLPNTIDLEEIDIRIGAALLEASSLVAKEISLDVGAGSMAIDNLKTRELEINVGMGQMTLHNCDIKEGEFEVGIGNLYFNGDIENNIDAKVGLGNMEFLLTAGRDDYNYELEVSMGSIAIGDQYYAGSISENKRNKGANATLDLECSMGNIDVSFLE
ncbi:MAG: DUF4097 family beta strand repeat-containing protein [Lachnospiraceae bacterium]